MILSKKLRWTKALALTLVLMALSCSSNDNETPAPDLGDDGPVTNEAPVFQDPPVGAIEVDEDITDQDVIVALKAEDPEGDEFTFSILEDDDALFEINQDGELSLLAGKQLNAEESDSHSVTVAVKDSNGNQATLQLSIAVLEVEEMALQDDPDAFLTTWSVGDNDKIFIRVNPDYDDYDYQIDWGDGSPVENVTGNEPPEHTYEAAGDYQVAIKGTFPAIQTVNSDGSDEEKNAQESNALKLTSIDQWGNNAWQSMESAFSKCVNMGYTATDTPNLEAVTSTREMFRNCFSFNGDIGDWDVSKVEDMSRMFFKAEIFNGDISEWVVDQVTDMNFMFSEATAFNQDIGGWKVGQVTNMSGMFNLTLFNQDISTWDVSQVIGMSNMFTGNTSFNQNLSAWGDKLGNVTNMSLMFAGASAFEGLGLQDWNVDNVENMFAMFFLASSFNQDIGNWNVGKVTTMARMFQDATAFDRSLGTWDLSSIGPGTDNGTDLDSLEGMLDNSGLSRESFNATLIGWGNNDKTPDDIILGAEGVTWCGQDAVVAKNDILETEKGWDIQGDDYLGFTCEDLD